MKNPTSSGFTLIEIMVVVAILALMMGMVTFGSSSRELKNQAVHLTAGIRYAYNRAIKEKMVVRLVMDLDENRYWLEEGEVGAVALPSAEDSDRESKPKKKISPKIKESSTEDESTETSLKKIVQPEEGDKPVKKGFVEAEDSALKRTTLTSSIKFRDVLVAPAETPRQEGMAYLYFFPNGMTQKAYIHLSDEDEKNNLTLIVSPLTGRATVLADYVEKGDEDRHE